MVTQLSVWALRLVTRQGQGKTTGRVGNDKPCEDRRRAPRKKAPGNVFNESFWRLNSGVLSRAAAEEQGSQRAACEHQGMGDAVIGGIPCYCFDKGLNGRGSLMDLEGGRSPKLTDGLPASH